MFKKIIGYTAIAALAGVLVFGAINRTQAKSGETKTAEPSGEVHGYQGVERVAGTAQGNNDAGANQNGGSGVSIQLAQQVHEGAEVEKQQIILQGAAGELSDEDAAALIFMREEEKLAHDVYVAMYELWGVPLFINISRSEATHMEQVRQLLEKYNLEDPYLPEQGVFTNPDLQTLYDSLITWGSQSLGDALKVGAAIEEIDILDLQEHLAITTNPDIQQVFTNLVEGSKNHLRSFVAQLEGKTGEIYQPAYLSIEAYQAIVTSTATNGSGNGNRGGGGNAGGKGGGTP